MGRGVWGPAAGRSAAGGREWSRPGAGPPGPGRSWLGSGPGDRWKRWLAGTTEKAGTRAWLAGREGARRPERRGAQPPGQGSGFARRGVSRRVRGAAVWRTGCSVGRWAGCGACRWAGSGVCRLAGCGVTRSAGCGVCRRADCGVTWRPGCGIAWRAGRGFGALASRGESRTGAGAADALGGRCWLGLSRAEGRCPPLRVPLAWAYFGRPRSSRSIGLGRRQASVRHRPAKGPDAHCRRTQAAPAGWTANIPVRRCRDRRMQSRAPGTARPNVLGQRVPRRQCRACLLGLGQRSSSAPGRNRRLGPRQFAVRPRRGFPWRSAGYLCDPRWG